MRATFLPLVLLSIALPSAADATWSHAAGENNLICGAPDYQGRVCTGRAADGSTVVAWSDQRDGQQEIYRAGVDSKHPSPFRCLDLRIST